MKQLTIILIFLFISGAAWGQCANQNKELVIITHSGDTLKGWCDGDWWPKFKFRRGVVVYYSKGLAICEREVIPVKEVKEYIFNESRYMPMERSGKTFAELQVNGKVEYFLHYTQRRNPATYELISYHYIRMNGEIIRISDNNYERQLRSVFSDCEELYDKITKREYSLENDTSTGNISGIVMFYNQWLAQQNPD